MPDDCTLVTGPSDRCQITGDRARADQRSFACVCTRGRVTAAAVASPGARCPGSGSRARLRPPWIAGGAMHVQVCCDPTATYAPLDPDPVPGAPLREHTGRVLDLGDQHDLPPRCGAFESRGLCGERVLYGGDGALRDPDG